jgi:HK97 family phage major capsid protein
MMTIQLLSVADRREKLAERVKWVETSHELDWDSLDNYREALDDALVEIQEHKAVLTGVDGAHEVLAKAQNLAGQTEEAQKTNGGFKSFGEYLTAVANFGDVMKKDWPVDPRLVRADGEPGSARGAKHDGVGGWVEKQMVENVGASGGFVVFPEYRAELFAALPYAFTVRNRATVIPMRSRQIIVPALLQSGTTAGVPHWYGGVTATWIEEAQLKQHSEPEFRQIDLVAYKLVVYTRASDELLADAAIGLEAFLRSPMGFSGAIAWEEQNAFLNGTGAGQPLGVITALAALGLGPTLTVARAGAGLAVADFANMLSAFYGQNPCWHISRSQMANLIQLNGPAGNPSYVFIPSARDGVPDTLFGYPIFWTEMMPLAGVTGDILLADWGYYYIGDRQVTTIDSSNHEYFRYDLTSWRAVHRVGGLPALNAPLTYSDGTTQVSPFVVLGAAAS